MRCSDAIAVWSYRYAGGDIVRHVHSVGRVDDAGHATVRSVLLAVRPSRFMRGSAATTIARVPQHADDYVRVIDGPLAVTH